MPFLNTMFGKINITTGSQTGCDNISCSTSICGAGFGASETREGGRGGLAYFAQDLLDVSDSSDVWDRSDIFVLRTQR